MPKLLRRIARIQVEKGGSQAVGGSRGGRSTKMHSLADVVAGSIAVALTRGNIAEGHHRHADAGNPRAGQTAHRRTRPMTLIAWWQFASGQRHRSRHPGPPPAPSSTCSTARHTAPERHRAHVRRLKNWERIATRSFRAANTTLVGVTNHHPEKAEAVAARTGSRRLHVPSGPARGGSTQ